MKKSKYWSSKYGYLYGVVLLFMALCLTGCKDDDGAGGESAFDPSKPVVITDFLPKKGGYGSNLILYGDNFGNDPSRLKVTVGGKEANIITVKNKSLYCVVPSKAYDGDIQVSILNDNGEEIAYAEADGLFEYEKKWLVTTIIGTHYENQSDEEQKEGPFDDCGCFKSMTWFSFDPTSNFDRLYLTTHDAPPNRLIDFEQEYVSYFTVSGLDRPSIVNWMLNEPRDMVLSDDIDPDNRIGSWIFNRASGFTEGTGLFNARSVCGAIIHPRNGEMYYSSYRTPQVYRYDFETKEVTNAFRSLRTNATMRLVVHPTGKYAYITQTYGGGAGRYIARTDYDEAEKNFTSHYIVAGNNNNSGYEDAVGDKALLSRPGQGVFVKNPDYAGDEDEYDYYFCDQDNHCIRILTPTGRVTTFAGRGNNGTSGYTDGDLRLEARFNAPCAIAYDEKRECFYVGDSGNKVIRKIGKEE